MDEIVTVTYKAMIGILHDLQDRNLRNELNIVKDYA
jgi:hypothetical protein